MQLSKLAGLDVKTFGRAFIYLRIPRCIDDPGTALRLWIDDVRQINDIERRLRLKRTCGQARRRLLYSTVNPGTWTCQVFLFCRKIETCP